VKNLASRLLRAPLVHFLILGAGLFLLFGFFGEADEDRRGQIVISRGDVDQLVLGWTKTWQRPPTAEELSGLIEDRIREEVYYREALALGLDSDDTIVRRRMRQKLEFLTDDLTLAVNPTDEELQSFLTEHAERFHVAPRVSFEHVYLSRDRRRNALEADVERILSVLTTGGGDVDPESVGDPILLPRRFDLVSEDEVQKLFGPDFAAGLAGLPTGRWTGPVESGYGVHLVLIRAREAAAAPSLDQVRRAVERDWRAMRRDEAAAAFYETLRERYTITVEQGGET